MDLALLLAELHELTGALDADDLVSPDRLRTGLRVVQQAWATWRYERRLIPA